MKDGSKTFKIFIFASVGLIFTMIGVIGSIIQAEAASIWFPFCMFLLSVTAIVIILVKENARLSDVANHALSEAAKRQLKATIRSKLHKQTPFG